MPPWPQRRPHALRWGVLVLLAHALLFTGLFTGRLQLGVWQDRRPAASAQAPLVVRLWGPPVVVPATTGPVPPTAARRASTTKPTPSVPPAGPAAMATEPQAITLPAAGAPPPASAPPARATLDLQLPLGASAPWRQRNPALDDPRSNSARLNMEQQLAAAMGGDGQWQVERLDIDRIRMRQGQRCVMATRSRAGQLELAGGNFRNAWLMSEC